MKPRAWIALLRGINVGGRARLPMGELQSLCEALGWSDVKTYIQSGNVVLKAPASRTDVEARLERAIEGRFGLAVPVIARAARDWPAYIASNPWPDVAELEPNLLMLALPKSTPVAGAVDALRDRAANGERIAPAGDGLWIHYAGGAGRSKLSPGLIDRAVGSPVTTRNWRTVMELQRMVDAMA
jgi:uncharacterized protein (DUF1697 family)